MCWGWSYPFIHRYTARFVDILWRTPLLMWIKRSLAWLNDVSEAARDDDFFDHFTPIIAQDSAFFSRLAPGKVRWFFWHHYHALDGLGFPIGRHRDLELLMVRLDLLLVRILIRF